MRRDYFAEWIRKADSDDGVGGGERHASLVMAGDVLRKDANAAAWVNDKCIPLPHRARSYLADLRVTGGDMMTPLGWIAKEMGAHDRRDLQPLTEALLIAGAKVDMDVWAGDNPLTMALRATVGESMLNLYTQDADGGNSGVPRVGEPWRFGKLDKGMNRWLKTLLTANGGRIPATGDGIAPLVLAVLGKGGRAETIECLIAGGARADDACANGMTAWDVTFKELSVLSPSMRKKWDSTIQALLTAPCDPDLRIHPLKQRTLRQRWLGLKTADNSPVWGETSDILMDQRRALFAAMDAIRLKNRVTEKDDRTPTARNAI